MRADTPLVGVDAVLQAGTTDWPLEAHFEHAVLILEGTIDVEGQPVEAGHLAYLGQGRQALALRTDRQARLLLLGGEPFAEPILMWWNFVARSRAEVEAATPRVEHAGAPLRVRGVAARTYSRPAGASGAAGLSDREPGSR